MATSATDGENEFMKRIQSSLKNCRDPKLLSLSFCFTNREHKAELTKIVIYFFNN
jgi:hypothetical protein